MPRNDTQIVIMNIIVNNYNHLPSNYRQSLELFHTKESWDEPCHLATKLINYILASQTAIGLIE